VQGEYGMGHEGPFASREYDPRQQSKDRAIKMMSDRAFRAAARLKTACKDRAWCVLMQP
jgi:hypothetical protein